MTTPNPYRAAGTFSGEAYTEREADCRLFEAIKQNARFPYMLAPRQSGKSSLIKHTMDRLPAENLRGILIDLSVLSPDALKNYDIFLDEFFAACLKGLGARQPGPTSGTFLERLTEALERCSQQMVLFLDEVDVLSHAPFKDNLFSAIRSAFNQRVEKELGFDRVQFVLAGAAKPSELISDSYRSPFNVGEAIELADFTEAEVARIEAGLRKSPATVAKGISEVLYRHASGSVYLTQLILERLWEEGVRHPDQSLTTASVEGVVDQIVASAAKDLHFSNIYKLLQRDAAALDVLQRLLRNQAVNEADREVLLHTGVGGKNRPFRNLIYERVFGAGGPLDVVPQAATIQLPYTRNPLFVDRSDVLSAIHERLNTRGQGNSAGGAVVVLTGMAGIGKTAAAVEYAYRFNQHYQDVLWVQAEGSLSLEFQKVALQLKLIDDAMDSRAAQRDADRAIRELNSQVPRLLILDNALDESSLRRWLPLSGGCRILITSRFSGWSTTVPTITVPVLERSAAVELLARRGNLAQDQDCDRVAAELGDLPLALEQAAAFVQQGRNDYNSYLQHYRANRRKLLEQGIGPGRSVFSILQSSAVNPSPLAQAILRLASFYEKDVVPLNALEAYQELLQDGVDQLMGKSSRLGDRGWFSRKSAALPTPADISQAVGELADHSLIALERESLSIHPLMRTVQIETLDQTGQSEWRKRTARVPPMRSTDASLDATRF